LEDTNMTGTAIAEKFSKVANEWKQALAGYSDTQLTTQPAPDEWSMGQVYIHILRSALFFHGKQVEICLQSSDNADAETHPMALSMVEAGSMPNERIKVPPSPQYTPPQPESKAQILGLFGEVEALVQRLGTQLDSVVQSGTKIGKTPHPRFGHLSADAWLQMIEMHYRHHLHQKERIDAFLKEHLIA
jgi:DinB superfamily